MKQKDDKWTIRFRKRMEGYVELPPSGVWERLDEELSFNSRQRHRFPRIAVAAVILLFISVGLYFLTYTSDNDGIITADALSRILEHHKVDKPFRKTIVTDSKKIITHAPIYVRTVKKRTENNVLGEENIAVAQSIDTIQAPSQEKVEDLSEQKNTLQEKKEHFTNGSSVGKDFEIRQLPKKSKGWSIGVSVGNNVIASAENHYGFSNLDRSGIMPRSMNMLQTGENETSEDQKITAAYQQIMLKNINLETTTDIKHHFPVTFGISLRKDLSNSFSIETGLTYTLLSSDLKAGNDIYYSQEQRLHYLGIPLKAGWYFVKKRRVSLYLSAGGAVEKCVKSQLKTHYEMQNDLSFIGDDHLDVKKLQWSVLASLGAQFNITDHFGIYAEPGAIYYFDDGTDVSTIRKEKPFNINLQIGLRFGF